MALEQIIHTDHLLYMYCGVLLATADMNTAGEITGFILLCFTHLVDWDFPAFLQYKMALFL